MTPIRQQYLHIKQQYPNTIVFFRLGDFYETFDDDARLVAGELELVLTSRPVAKGERVPMAGVPYHAADSYIARLIANGHKVAICEQTGEQPQDGLMPRDVVRVVTPGTLVEPSLLEARRNNYLAAVCVHKSAAAVAYCDVSTGEFAVTQFAGADADSGLQRELERLQPAELLLSDAQPVEQVPAAVHLTLYPNWHFDVETARTALLKHFQVSTLDGFGVAVMPQAIGAAGAIVQYLQETQAGPLTHLTALRAYSTDAFMLLDAATRRHLELTRSVRGDAAGSLLGVLDHTLTPMGARLLHHWVQQPLLERASIEARLDAVQVFLERALLRDQLRGALKGIGDLERLTNRIAQGVALPRELVTFRATLEKMPVLAEKMAAVATSGAYDFRLDVCAEVSAWVEAAIGDEPPATMNEGGIIRQGSSAELDAIVQASRDAKAWVANLEHSERERTGIKTLKVGYNQVFGYYIEVSRTAAHNAPANYLRKQTLANAERFITPELKEYESLILNAQERILALERQLYKQLLKQIGEHAGDLLASANAVAQLDVHLALAHVAMLNRYVRPRLSDERTLSIRGGRHPVVERSARDEPFVPNDLQLDDGELMVLTGPNMAGKTTFLRQVALITLMAQVGSFVPADEATISIVDRIFTRVGAQDDISAGQSTFMVEMVETANILHHATPRSLLVLDEIGRGTSTYDGLSIAWAVIEYIHNHPRLQAKTLFATHYHELIALAERLPRVRNFNVAVSESAGAVTFLRTIVPGGADRSYGIHVAQLAGLPRPIIQRAEEILRELEQRAGERRGSRKSSTQFALFSLDDPLVQELRALDLAALSPLEALNKLYEWQNELKKHQ